MRAGFDARKENDPELTIVARRLDVVAPLVWAGHANATWESGDRTAFANMTMLTGIDLPAAGCWEIAARYSDPDGKVQTLSYVVLLKP